MCSISTSTYLYNVLAVLNKTLIYTSPLKVAAVLATFAHPNHIVIYTDGDLLTFRFAATDVIWVDNFNSFVISGYCFGGKSPLQGGDLNVVLQWWGYQHLQ
ncbi:hypothetical protein EAY42_17025 [Vibrio anguillarum]|nr:hypothetical protein [Vibrio anguillarum]PSD41768.1 hypothetical protein C7E22_09260 [Vibrio sp. V02_P2A34T13]